MRGRNANLSLGTAYNFCASHVFFTNKTENGSISETRLLNVSLWLLVARCFGRMKPICQLICSCLVVAWGGGKEGGRPSFVRHATSSTPFKKQTSGQQISLYFYFSSSTCTAQRKHTLWPQLISSLYSKRRTAQ